MPKRNFRSRRRDDSEEESDDLQTALAETTLAHHEKVRTQGVNVAVALDGPADVKTKLNTNGEMKYHEDVMEKRMQEYINTNLEENYETVLSSEPVPHKKSRLTVAEAEEDINHLQTPAVAEVSVPGFNTAITKVSLKSREHNVPPSITLGKDKSSQEKPRSAPWIPCDLFPKKFGKSKKAKSKRSRLL